jgi:hypothetical protein
MKTLKINKEYPFSKVGIDEIKGLKAEMINVFKPILNTITYKSDCNDSILEEAEYKSRDGFIPHSDNCGGLIISQIIPYSEKYAFGFIEFGDCDEQFCTCHVDNNSECELEVDGDKDAILRIWFKFEGINDKGELEFYLVMSGSNNDAPYFREKYQPVLFERSFTSKSISGIKKAASKSIKDLLKVIK